MNTVILLVGTPTCHSSSSLLSFLCPYTHMPLQLLTAFLPLSVHPHVSPVPHCSPSCVHTHTCHCSSSRLSFLCPHNHQHTDPANSILTTLSLTPSLSTANNENGPPASGTSWGKPRPAALPTSQWHSRPDSRRPVYKETIRPTRGDNPHAKPLLIRSRRRPLSPQWPPPGRRPGLKSLSPNPQQPSTGFWEVSEESSRECQNRGS